MRPLLLAGLALALPVLAQAQTAPAQAPTQVQAQAAPGGDVAAAVAQASVKPVNVDVTQNVNDRMQAYLDKSGLRAREAKHELEILFATAAVPVPSTNPDWVKQRSMAYDAALLQVEADYVKEQGLRITDETTQQLYQAADQTPPPYDAGRTPGQEGELLRKVLAVANGSLDGELRKLGLDPKEYNEAPAPQRYVQMQAALKRKTLRQAAGELVGLMPVQTFEGQDGRGNYVIGVVAVMSPLMKDAAAEVLGAHGQIAANPARAQDLAVLYADPRQLVGEFGVRRLFDSMGLPVLVSFGQWSSSYSGSDPGVAEQFRRAARDQADARADGQLAQFLAGSMQVESDSTTGNAVEKAAERLPDGYVQDDAATRTVTDGLLETLRNRAHVQVTGIKTLYSWSLTHPETGKKIVGVIRMWSAAGEKMTRELRDRRPPAAVSALSALQAPQGAPSVTQGRDLMNASDF